MIYDANRSWYWFWRLKSLYVYTRIKRFNCGPIFNWFASCPRRYDGVSQNVLCCFIASKPKESSNKNWNNSPICRCSWRAACFGRRTCFNSIFRTKFIIYCSRKSRRGHTAAVICKFMNCWMLQKIYYLIYNNKRKWRYYRVPSQPTDLVDHAPFNHNNKTINYRIDLWHLYSWSSWKFNIFAIVCFFLTLARDPLDFFFFFCVLYFWSQQSIDYLIQCSASGVDIAWPPCSQGVTLSIRSIDIILTLWSLFPVIVVEPPFLVVADAVPHSL